MLCTYNTAPAITLVYTTGQGAHEFVLDEDHDFVLKREDIKASDSGEFWGSGRMGKEWPPEHRRLIDELKDRGYKNRHGGALVPNINEILISGGLWAYPGSEKDPQGKLRLYHELIPVAYITEQQDAMVTDGVRPILDREITDIEQRSPGYISTREEGELALEILSGKYGMEM